MPRLHVSILGLPALLLITAHMPAPGHAAPIQTSDEATARALRFFQDVGWEPDRGGQYPEGDEVTALSVRRHGADCWDVTLNNLSAQVSRGTSMVVGCQKRRLFRDMPEDSPTIEEAAANELALSYLAAGGVPLDDAVIWKSELTRDRDAWRVYLRREHNGFLFYEHDWDLVILEPEDGRLWAYGHNFRSPLPDTTRVLLTEEQAVSVAREYLADLALEAGGLTSAELLIVQPDDYWEHEAVNQVPPAWELPVALQSRLAWVVIFDKPWEGTMVWIDSETGAPLGGAHTRTVPQGDVKMWRAAPRHTTEITIQAREGAAGPVVLAADSIAGQRLLAGLAELPDAQAPGCETAITLRFSAKERTHLVGYSSQANRLVLLEKQYRGKTIRGELAWEVSEEVKQLLSQYLG